MRAVVYDRHGGVDALELREIPEPAPRAGEVLVRVEAAALNPVDWKLLRGDFPGFMAKRAPRGTGSDFSGRVTAIGTNVRSFKVGDAVFGAINPFASREGGLAETVCAKESEIVALPAGLSWIDAAALPVAGASAVDCLRRLGMAQPGQRVMIVGATGGVGAFAVQLAKVWGVHVTAVCREANVPFARELGADEVIAYDVTDPRRIGATFDLVVDVAPAFSFGQCTRLLAARGIYVTTVPGPRVAFDALRTRWFAGRRARFLMVRITPATLTELAQLAVTGKLRASVTRVFPFTQARSAFGAAMTGQVRGKVVVRLGEAAEP